MKKTTLKTRLWALAATLLLLVSLLAMPVSAANTPATGTTTTFNKYLVFDKNANVPNVTFTFTIEAGAAVDASTENGNRAIYSGTDAARTTGLPVLKVDSTGENQSATVTFAPTDTAGAKEGKPGDNSATDFKYATKLVTVDFTGVKYNTPGIYRYKITETASTAPGITDDVEAVRTLDVYVKYSNEESQTLAVDSYVLYEGIPTTDAQFAQDGSKGQAATDTKSDGYVNEYTTYDLTLAKTVTGNQGDRDKFFKFTVEISNAVPGTVYNVIIPTDGPTETDLEEGDVLSGDGQNVNLNELTVGAAQGEDTTGSVTATYYLKHGQSIVIQGLTAGTKYEITETNYSTDGYTTTNTDNATDGKTTTKKDMPAEDYTVTFTNHKEGTVPTGILLETAPYLILGAVVVVGLVVLFATRRRRTRE